MPTTPMTSTPATPTPATPTPATTPAPGVETQLGDASGSPPANGDTNASPGAEPDQITPSVAVPDVVEGDADDDNDVVLVESNQIVHLRSGAGGGVTTAAAPTAAVQNSLNQARRLSEQIELCDAKHVKHTLSNLFLDPAKPRLSVFEELQESTDKAVRRVVAERVLSALKQTSEHTNEAVLAVFRYVQLTALWKGHPNPVVRNASEFIRTLDGHDVIEIALAVGAEVLAQKHASIREIESRWGAGWHREILRDIPDPAWAFPAAASRDKLRAIALNAKNNLTLKDAITGWTGVIKLRCDPQHRRTHNIRGSTAKTLTVADVHSIRSNHARAVQPEPEREGIAPAEQVQGMARLLPHQNSHYRTPQAPRTTSTSVTTFRIDTTTTTTNTNTTTTTTANNNTSKRGRDGSGQNTTDGGTKRQRQGQRQGQTLEKAPPGHQRCEGPALASFIRIMVARCSDEHVLDPVFEDRALHCCQACLPHALPAWNAISQLLPAYAAGLEAVKQHRKDKLILEAWPKDTPFTGRTDSSSDSDSDSDSDSSSST